MKIQIRNAEDHYQSLAELISQSSDQDSYSMSIELTLTEMVKLQMREISQERSYDDSNELFRKALEVVNYKLFTALDDEDKGQRLRRCSKQVK